MKKQPEFIALYLAITDFILINYNAVLLNYFLDYISVEQQLLLISGINICWFASAYALGSYKVGNLLTAGSIFMTTFKALFVHMTGVTFVYCYVWAGPFPRIIFTLYVIFVFILLFLNRFLFRRYLRRISQNGYTYKNALVVGSDFEARKLRSYLVSDHAFGVNFAGFIVENKNKFVEENFKDQTVYQSQKSTESSKSGRFLQRKNRKSYSDGFNESLKEKVIGDLSELPEIINSGKIDEIYWTLPISEEKNLQAIIDLCENKMVRFYRVPQLSNIMFRNYEVELYDGMPILHYRSEPLEEFHNRLIKRVFDIVFSGLVIILILSWLIPLVWLVMKFTMPGPVFFVQDRSGKNNKTFKLLKFRSMLVNQDADSLQATKNDARITKFGAFLRKSSLDEMPQFINVFIGDMTVVGPRPHMLKHTKEYAELVDKFMVRHLIKPGITGWAQVNGYRGGTETIDLMIGRVEHDVWYLENWSIWLDLHIVYRTVINALGGEKNAY